MNLFNKAETVFGANSQGNISLQNSTINQVLVLSGSDQVISLLGTHGEYEQIQDIIARDLKAARETHPIKSHFTVNPVVIGDKVRLVSVPKNDEALQLYPKSMRFAASIEKSLLNGIGEGETPIQYSYRTQKPLEMKPTEYREYLGNIENPYTDLKHDEDMLMVLYPPKFPPPRNACFVAGSISVPTFIHQEPSLTYGETHLVSEQTSAGLVFSFVLNEIERKSKLNMHPCEKVSLEERLLREQFLQQIVETGKIDVFMDERLIITFPITKEQLAQELFQHAAELIKFLSNLKTLEDHFGCRFDYDGSDVDFATYVSTCIMAAGLSGKGHRLNMNSIDRISLPYDKIDDSTLLKDGLKAYYVEAQNVIFSIYGVNFICDKLAREYRNVRINNHDEVVKGVADRSQCIEIEFAALDNARPLERIESVFNLKLAEADTQLQ